MVVQVDGKKDGRRKWQSAVKEVYVRGKARGKVAMRKVISYRQYSMQSYQGRASESGVLSRAIAEHLQ